jgi:hypothetical protein
MKMTEEMIKDVDSKTLEMLSSVATFNLHMLGEKVMGEI